MNPSRQRLEGRISRLDGRVLPMRICRRRTHRPVYAPIAQPGESAVRCFACEPRGPAGRSDRQRAGRLICFVMSASRTPCRPPNSARQRRQHDTLVCWYVVAALDERLESLAVVRRSAHAAILARRGVNALVLVLRHRRVRRCLAGLHLRFHARTGVLAHEPLPLLLRRALDRTGEGQPAGFGERDVAVAAQSEYAGPDADDKPPDPTERPGRGDV